jgi:membrane protein YqaA with SNARE-associated domain
VLQRTYDWVMSLAARRDAIWVLAAIAFIESSVFPIPPDVLLIPMVLATRGRAWRIALVCTIASVLGGVLGYAIGFLFYETVGRLIVEFYGLQDSFVAFQTYFDSWGWWFVIFAGVTPFPYKVITIASGIAGFDFIAFTAASILARTLRFYLVAALLYRYGPPVRAFIERRLGLVTTVFFVLLFGGFVVIKYLL